MILFKLFSRICFLISFSLFAQNANNLNVKTSMSAFDTEISIGKSGLWVPKKVVDNTISGSVYLFVKWDGLYTVVSKNQNATHFFNLNYNLQTKTLETAVGNDSIFQYDLNKIDYVKERNVIYKVIRNEQVNGLFLELYVGKQFQIYKETVLDIQKGPFDRLTQTKINDDKYVQSSLYYVVQNGVFRKEKLNKKMFLKLVDDKNEAVSLFASKYNLNYSVDKDLSRILDYYSKL